METTPQSTNKPMVAGILNIVAGALNLFGFICGITAIIVKFIAPYLWQHMQGYGFPTLELGKYLGIITAVLLKEMFPGFPLSVGLIQAILIITPIFMVLVVVLPLFGGTYALRRKKWGLVLAGSIAAILGPMPLGIAATIFTILSKKEFA